MDELKPGSRVSDKVTLLHMLGEGAMGSVWVAQHETLRTEVAVKFISEHATQSRSDAAERFRREATAAAQIKSPHVVQMLDHGVMPGGTLYIVMELLEGESLHERIDRDGWLSLADTGLVITHVARALASAHKIGVIHRDIKPHNIFLVSAHGELFAKVLDFGVAKQTRAGGTELTEPGTIVGTPQYVSRDLIMSGQHKKIDEKVDLWSLAVVAYKCLTCTLPFDGESLAEVCTALAAGTFDPPSLRRAELPRRYDRWFARALDPNPSARFSGAEEMAQSFTALAREDDHDHELEPTSEARPTRVEGTTSARVTVPRALPPRRTALSRFLPAAIVVGVVGGVFGYYAWRARQPLPPIPAREVPPPPPEPSSAPPLPVPSATVAPPPSATVAPPPSATAAPAAPLRPHEVAVPAGKVWMGCVRDGDLDCDDDELPLHQVEVSGFYIDRLEVRVGDFTKCVAAGRCGDSSRLKSITLENGDHEASPKCNWEQPAHAQDPMNCVNYDEASRYCAFAGSRLPSEAEWTRAARGDDKREFPWGEDAASCSFTVMTEAEREGCGKLSSWPAGAMAKDVSPAGARDLAGNVREWVADWYDARYFDETPPADPPGPATGTRRVAAGGSYGTATPRLMRISNRQSYPPATRSVYLGFRCARSM